MENYTLAEQLGAGAFAKVYKAFNWDTGQTTAVKQISLENIAQADLPDIMGEIHLLKNLNHPNIVQYRGFVKTVDHLHIILEYCENGSLHTVMKKFGCFPEPLVALYVLQILNGLKYLHDQGVIHRDIKASNILLDKTGAVRLADFGVSTRVAPSLALSTNSPESAQSDNSVAGSPYWMSPEIISHQISTPASDIWSLGIVIIELLTSKPPYSNLAPLPALFKIVNEDSPPIPGKLSEGGKEFLVECFQKDWRLRVSAKRLLKHPWINEARARMDKGAEKESGGGFDDDVLRVKQWNQALNNRSPKINLDESTPQSQQKQRPRKHRLVRRPSSELASALQSDHKLPLLAISTKGQILPPVANTVAPVGNGSVAVALSLRNVAETEEGEDDDNWDVDFEEGIPISKIIALDRETTSSNSTSQSASDTESQDDSEGDEEELNSRTIRPSNPNSPSISPQATLGFPSNSASNRSGVQQRVKFGEDDVEDYSDLVGEDEEDPFRGKVDSLRLYNLSAKRILHPKDLSDTYLVNSPLASPLLPSPLLTSFPSLSGSARPHSSSMTPPAGKENTIEKFSEVGNEDDYSDLFVKPVMDGTSNGLKVLRLPVRLASKTWLGDEDSDEEDPFSNLDPPPSLPKPVPSSTIIANRTKLTKSPAATVRSTGSGSGSRKMNTLEMNLRRDRLAQSSLRVTELLDVIASFSSAARSTRNGSKGGSSGRKMNLVVDEELLRDSSLHLLEILEESPEIKSHFLTSHGLLTVLQTLKSVDNTLVLSKEKEREVLAILLRLFNLIIDNDLVPLEKICLIGACPVVTRFVSNKFSREIRLEAALFIGAMCRVSILTLQMFISCDGLSILVSMLDENYEQSKDIIWLGVDCISRVFELQGSTPRNDYCRLFLASGLLEPLSEALASTCLDEDDLAESAKAKIVQIFCIFSQSDRNVKIGLGSLPIALRLVKALKMLSVDLLLPLLKTIKYLTMAPETLDILQEARIIETLVQILAVNLDQNRLSAEIVISLFNLSRLSKSRQSVLAQTTSAIPILITLISSDSPLKQFALPILCDFAQAGKKSRAVLGREGGMEVYLEVLGDPFWSGAGLEAILAWLQDASALIEEKLLEPNAIEAILKVFVKSRTATLDSILETFHKILRISSSLTIRLASHPSFFKRIIDRLARGGKAVTRLNLLKILKTSLESLAMTKLKREQSENHEQLILVVGQIAEADQAILVRQLAKELAKDLGGFFGAASERGTLIGLGKRRSLRKKSAEVGGRKGGESKKSGSGEGVRKTSSSGLSRKHRDEV